MTQQGWECPKCLNVYAPWVEQCSKCPGFQWTFTTDSGKAIEHVCDFDCGESRCLICGVSSEKKHKHVCDFSDDLTVPRCLICGETK